MTEPGTLNFGSGNDGRGGPGTPAFLVVEHSGRKVAIGRNPNYQETIASIKKNVDEFKSTPNDQIIMLAFLTEVDDHVQLTEEVWTDLLPRLVTIRVESKNIRHNHSASASNWSVVSDETPTSARVERVAKENDRAQEEVTSAGAASSPAAHWEAALKAAAAHAKLGHGEGAEKRGQQHRVQTIVRMASPAPVSLHSHPPTNSPWVEAVVRMSRGTSGDSPGSRPNQPLLPSTDDDELQPVPQQIKLRLGRGRGRGRGISLIKRRV